MDKEGELKALLPTSQSLDQSTSAILASLLESLAR